MKTTTSLLALLLTGCAKASSLPPQASEALADLRETPEALGALVYRGRVAARNSDAEALFHYERRVVDSSGGRVASHITSRPDGEVILLHTAEHTTSYTLRSFEEIHGQTGVVGRITVDEAQRATFEVTIDGQRRTRTETGRDPVHVGPTLFGFTLAHWDALIAGETVPLRFAVVEDLRTYHFALRLGNSGPETTVIRMRATSPFVRLAVSEMVLAFDTDTRCIVRFEGRVPPRIGAGRGRPLDARVNYEMIAESYR